MDSERDYRELSFTLVPIGSEALIQTQAFELHCPERRELRYAVKRSEREGVRFEFVTGPEALDAHGLQLREVSEKWLQSRRGPELTYSLGTLSDPDIVVGLALGPDGRLEAFVSWLPVPARKGWTLDLMRRRPDGVYGAMEALIVRSISEAAGRGVLEVSLGVAPRVIAAGESSGAPDRALWAMYWGLDRFQRSRSLQHFKAKFSPRWEDRFLAVPSASTLPEVLIAIVRVHVPPLSGSAVWIRSALGSLFRPPAPRPSPA